MRRENGAGAGYTLNLPLERGAGPAEYLELLDNVALPKIRRYRPEIIFVQVGADSHRDDPMVRLGTGNDSPTDTLPSIWARWPTSCATAGWSRWPAEATGRRSLPAVGRCFWARLPASSPTMILGSTS